MAKIITLLPEQAEWIDDCGEYGVVRWGGVPWGVLTWPQICLDFLYDNAVIRFVVQLMHSDI